MPVIRGPWSHDVSFVSVGTTLRGGVLRHRVLGLLRVGRRNLTLDLAAVRTIDASEIGELVRIYNIAVATGGKIRIVSVSPWVRRILELVGLFDLLTGRTGYPQMSRR